MLRYLNKSFFRFFLGFVAIIAVSFMIMSFVKVYEENKVDEENNLVIN